MEICKAPTLRLKALNKHSITRIMYIEKKSLLPYDPVLYRLTGDISHRSHRDDPLLYRLKGDISHRSYRDVPVLCRFKKGPKHHSYLMNLYAVG